MPRCHIQLKTKLAAVLLIILKIPLDHAKQMSDEQIISLVQWDHYPIRHSEGGPDEAWNLVPRAIIEHREKTANVDIPEIAKNKRLAKEHEEFRRRILQKEPGKSATPASRWPKRKFPNRGTNKSFKPH